VQILLQTEDYLFAAEQIEESFQYVLHHHFQLRTTFGLETQELTASE
jgi:hypothetical protein